MTKNTTHVCKHSELDGKDVADAVHEQDEDKTVINLEKQERRALVTARKQLKNQLVDLKVQEHKIQNSIEELSALLNGLDKVFENSGE